MYHQIWDLIGNPSSAVFPPERLDIFGQTREHPCCLYSILCQSLLLATREQSKLNWIESHSLPSFKYETKSIPSLAVHDIAVGDLSETRRLVYHSGHDMQGKQRQSKNPKNHISSILAYFYLSSRGLKLYQQKMLLDRIRCV